MNLFLFMLALCLRFTPGNADDCTCCGKDSGCSLMIEGDGDCDSDSECADGLKCGEDNCNDFRSLKGYPEDSDGGWDTTDDCCYNATGWAEEESCPGLECAHRFAACYAMWVPAIVYGWFVVKDAESRAQNAQSHVELAALDRRVDKHNGLAVIIFIVCSILHIVQGIWMGWVMLAVLLPPCVVLGICLPYLFCKMGKAKIQERRDRGFQPAQPAGVVGRVEGQIAPPTPNQPPGDVKAPAPAAETLEMVPAASPVAVPHGKGKTLVEQLKELREALDEGLISQEEHDALKKSVMKKMIEEIGYEL